jgi:hypothetical protein
MKQMLTFLFITFISYGAFAQSVIVNADGTHSIIIDNGATKSIVNPNGTHSTIIDNGATKTIANPNGTHSIIIDNGATKTIANPNGTHSTIIDNGPTKTIVNPNGTHSIIITNWKSLADIYPPAMAALKEMRNNKTKEVLDDNASTKLFADVAALNRTLGEGDKTIELFENIEKEHPDKAKLCWYWIKDALFDAKRYDIIKNYIGNPVNEFTLLKSQYDLLNAVQIEPNKKRPELKVFADNNFAEKSLKLIEFSVAVDDLKSAKEIREKAMTVVKDNRLRDFKIE